MKLKEFERYEITILEDMDVELNFLSLNQDEYGDEIEFISLKKGEKFIGDYVKDDLGDLYHTFINIKKHGMFGYSKYIKENKLSLYSVKIIMDDIKKVNVIKIDK